MVIRYLNLTPSTLPKELKSFNNRDIRWLFSYLEAKGLISREDSDWHQFDNKTRISIINDAINRKKSDRQHRELLEDIIIDHKEQVVSFDYLKWIEKGNQRLLICILLKIENLHNKKYKDLPIRYISLISSQNYYDEIITAIDLWPTHLELKIDFLDNLKFHWSQYRSDDKETRWIKAKDTKQVKWAWEYLKEHRKSIDQLNPVTNEELYNAVLASFDQMSDDHPSDKILFLDRMKKSWSQKKFRDSGKAKKTCYLSLTENARKQLDQLSAHYAIKPSNVIERLIEQEYSKHQESKNSKCL